MNIASLSRFFCVTVLTALLTVSLVGQKTPAQQQLAKYIQDNYEKQEVMITMRDGVKLFTSIYSPKRKHEKYPILLNRTPYTVAPYGKDAKGRDQFKSSLGPDDQFAREGYIFVYQDVRGRWMSEGKYEDIRPIIEDKKPGQTDESTDAWDTIDWLVKNVPNNNGKVGVYGISYPGFYASTASIDSHPALKACSPQAPVSDWFHGDDMHHNGALFLAQNYSFFASFGQDRPVPTHENYFKPWKGRDTQDGYDFYLRLGGLKEVSDYYETALGSRIKTWDEMLEHPNYDDFWKDRNVLPKLKNVKCATMTVGGWYDDEDLYGSIKTYQRIERQNPDIFNILVIGPWFHGGWVRSAGEWLGTAYFGSKTSEYYQRSIELPFFDHFLKDKGEISNLKEINTFDTGSNTWRALDRWDPKAGITATDLYLTAGGKLSFEPITGDSRYDEYVSDPMHPVPYTQKITRNYPRDFMTEDQRFASTRPDVLVYETDPLTDDLTIAGDIHPELWVSSSGTDSDFIIKLIDVFPDDYSFPETGSKLPDGKPETITPPKDSAWSVFQPGGYQMLLRGEPFPARFRSSFEKPEALIPNTPAKIRFEMTGAVHTFKKGHRIMVQIQSTWFPLVARNPQKFMPNYQDATASDFQKATERVYYGGKQGSHLSLPILKEPAH
jgi:uncharacterized protein